MFSIGAGAAADIGAGAAAGTGAGVVAADACGVAIRGAAGRAAIRTRDPVVLAERPAADRGRPYALRAPPSANRMQRMTGYLNWICADQDEGDDAILLRAIDPVMDRPALHENVAGLERDDHVVVELHVDLSGNHDGVVDRIGAVVARRHAGLIADDAKHGSMLDGGADRGGARVEVTIVVDRKAFGRPDDARRRAGPIGDDVLRNSVDLHDSASIGGVTGDDTADLQAHRIVLVVAKCAEVVRG